MHTWNNTSTYLSLILKSHFFLQENRKNIVQQTEELQCFLETLDLLRDKLCLGWILSLWKDTAGQMHTEEPPEFLCLLSAPPRAKNKLYPFAELKMTQQSMADILKKKKMPPLQSSGYKKQILIRKVNCKYPQLLSICRISQSLRGKRANRSEDSCLLLIALKSRQTMCWTGGDCTVPSWGLLTVTVKVCWGPQLQSISPGYWN